MESTSPDGFKNCDNDYERMMGFLEYSEIIRNPFNGNPIQDNCQSNLTKSTEKSQSSETESSLKSYSSSHSSSCLNMDQGKTHPQDCPFCENFISKKVNSILAWIVKKEKNATQKLPSLNSLNQTLNAQLKSGGELPQNLTKTYQKKETRDNQNARDS
ncbi:unnamed protein product [Moneuplotes crassus]|uniref:Uncharacterized protein n=1 Tax=Euplotes crassus TaxID=5936 RepID=A0AAD1UCH7_EUPCR|nr:unnamed protein product [Moneuplotes crassus]